MRKSKPVQLGNALAQDFQSVRLYTGPGAAGKALRDAEAALLAELAIRVSRTLAAYGLTQHPDNFVAAATLRPVSQLLTAGQDGHLAPRRYRIQDA